MNLQERHSEKASEQKPQRFASLLVRHRRGLILLGTITLLATYFVKDVAGENTKETLADMKAGISVYLASLPLLQQQLDELSNTSQALAGDASSVSRVTILTSIGNLSLRAQTTSLHISALLRSMPDWVHNPNADEVNGILDRTTQVVGAAEVFLGNAPAESRVFQSGARSLIQQFTDLENEVGRMGSELEIFERESSDRLERRSSWYGYIVTVLYLLGLALTVVSSLYGIDMPKVG